MSEVKGLDQLMLNLDKILKNSKYGTHSGLRRLAVDIGARAVEKAPLDDGDLRRSMTAETWIEGEDVKSEVAFRTKYAAKQHEEVTYKHQNGECKYLEKALNEKLALICDAVAKDIENRIKEDST